MERSRNNFAPGSCPIGPATAGARVGLVPGSKPTPGRRAAARCPIGAAAASLLGLLSCGWGMSACDAPARTGPVSLAPDGTHLATWQGPLASLFDDSIHPAAVGLALEGGRPQEDPLLRPRASAAELVARVRVSTVTREEVGAKITYHLVMQVVDEPLLEPVLGGTSVEIVIRQWSPAFGIASSLEGSLRNRTFIAFLRRFAGARGPELHWHLTADAPDIAAIVTTAGSFEEAPAQ